MLLDVVALIKEYIVVNSMRYNRPRERVVIVVVGYWIGSNKLPVSV